MRFALDDDREALRSTARDLLAERCPPAVVREAWMQAPDRAPWDALADAGALGVLVQESEGGLGLDETYLVPILEEAGRVALPHPLTETALVAAPLGLAGTMVATDLGVEGPTRDTGPGAAGVIVPAATYAEAFLLRSDGGLRLYEADEVEIEPVETVDGSRHCGRVRPRGPGELTFRSIPRNVHRVRPRGPGELVTDDSAAVEAAFERGVLGTAAELLGLSHRMLELTVDYAAQRHQFGRPIGSFQAVKHHLADARIQIEFAGPAVLYAAYAMAQGLADAGRSVSQAKWLAGNAASVTGRAALQCHGAIGYTTEYDLHLYLKRSWALARSWGGTDFHADRVAASIWL